MWMIYITQNSLRMLKWSLKTCHYVRHHQILWLKFDVIIWFKEVKFDVIIWFKEVKLDVIKLDVIKFLEKVVSFAIIPSVILR